MLDDDGADFLGMRLAVVLIVAALLLSLAAAYVYDNTERASRERARQEAGRIASLAAAEYASGSPGSIAAISVTIPDSVRRVAFGIDDPRTYFIEFRDGSREVQAANCRFSPATLYPGYHRLELEVAGADGDHMIMLREA